MFTIGLPLFVHPAGSIALSGAGLAASPLVLELDAVAPLLLKLVVVVVVIVGASVCPSSGLDFVRCVPLSAALS